MNEMSPSSIEAVLYYCYDKDWQKANPGSSHGALLLFLLQVYSAADFYLVDALRSRAYQEFETALKKDWDLGKLTDVVRTAYNMPDVDEMKPKQAVNTFCEERIVKLVDEPEFLKALDEIPELGTFLLPRIVKNGTTSTSVVTVVHEKIYRCMYCSIHFSETWGKRSGGQLFCPNCSASINRRTLPSQAIHIIH